MSGNRSVLRAVAKDVWILPIIESEFELIEVGLQMFRAHPMECASNRLLEETPCALNAVRMHVAAHPIPLRDD
jgi:hypothetical protein